MAKTNSTAPDQQDRAASQLLCDFLPHAMAGPLPQSARLHRWCSPLRCARLTPCRWGACNMSKTDYSDAGIKFPRLQVRIFSDGEKQLVDTWLWKEAGGERLQIMKSQLAGSMDYAHRLIGEFKVKH